MGGDLVMQKKGKAVVPNVKSFPVLAPALGCGIAEREVKATGFGVR